MHAPAPRTPSATYSVGSEPDADRHHLTQVRCTSTSPGPVISRLMPARTRRSSGAAGVTVPPPMIGPGSMSRRLPVVGPRRPQGGCIMGKPLNLRYANAKPRGYKRFGIAHRPCGGRCSDPEGDSPNGISAFDRKTAEFRGPLSVAGRRRSWAILMKRHKMPHRLEQVEGERRRDVLFIFSVNGEAE